MFKTSNPPFIADTWLKLLSGRCFDVSYNLSERIRVRLQKPCSVWFNPTLDRLPPWCGSFRLVYNTRIKLQKKLCSLVHLEGVVSVHHQPTSGADHLKFKPIAVTHESFSRVKIHIILFWCYYPEQQWLCGSSVPALPGGPMQQAEWRGGPYWRRCFLHPLPLNWLDGSIPTCCFVCPHGNTKKDSSEEQRELKTEKQKQPCSISVDYLPSPRDLQKLDSANTEVQLIIHMLP